MTDLEKLSYLNGEIFVSEENVKRLRELGMWWPENVRMTYMTLLKLLPDHIAFGKNKDKFYTLTVSVLHGISYVAHGYTDEELETEGMLGYNKGVHYVCSFNSGAGSTFEDCIVQTMADLLASKDVCRDREHVLGALNLPV